MADGANGWTQNHQTFFFLILVGLSCNNHKDAFTSLMDQQSSTAASEFMFEA